MDVSEKEMRRDIATWSFVTCRHSVLIADVEELAQFLIRRGWRKADANSGGAVMVGADLSTSPDYVVEFSA
ncbi:hypothetical protein [Acidocella aminolytica]|uniref:Uncharacterized protein n=1 Tax=Acidocella aminolytica 101 = DSM 11237 TaxID=1120923 RepID=A0A0D6PEM3_9PROT|nr:hypothetical protein [Acidocella aminolytica]GAN79806.1 hypothetical protein Aam_030_039 [Acidocella aminolytica 101 = DSM 11237]GBQ34314.1 hypothetical protein AA11237_0712 [Acidocella aminolytica 101 = DSM 11237]SHF36529.1 hypothetical protein SAMN02746095_02992 [Acidocella aminolytica 101 = DSM 11237]